VQKSEAHPLYVQSLPASLQNRRGCTPKRHSHFGIALQRQPLPLLRFSVFHGPLNTLHGSPLAFSAFFAVLDHQMQAPPLSPQPLPLTLSLEGHSYTKTSGCLPAGFLEGLPAAEGLPAGFLEGHPQRSSKICDVETCRPSNLPTLFNSFRMNTYKTVSKQRTLTTFRINTYANLRGGKTVGPYLWSAGAQLPLFRHLQSKPKRAFILNP